MSDSVIITLIIAVTIIIILFIFRRQLKDFIFNLNKEDGLKTEIHTHDPPSSQNESGPRSESTIPSAATPGTTPGVNISNNVQRGKRHRITAEREANIDHNRQIGEDNVIEATSPDPRITHLYQQINLLSINDFRTLCRNLDIDPAALSGPDQTTTLLDQLQAQNRIPVLIDAARQINPNLDWED